MADSLKFGLFSMNMDACSVPDGAAWIAGLAETAGFESLWAGEHVVLPDPQVPPSPMAPRDRILDPLITLTFLAARTTTIRLGTGVIVLSVSFGDVQAHPQPTRLPIVTGGHSPGAYRRAVERADGWYGFALDVAGTAHALAGLRDAASRYTRPAALGELEISVTPRRLPDLDEAARFAALGVHRLILMPPVGLDEPALADYVSSVGNSLIGRVYARISPEVHR